MTVHRDKLRVGYTEALDEVATKFVPISANDVEKVKWCERDNKDDLKSAEFPKILKRYMDMGYQCWLYDGDKIRYKQHPEYYKEVAEARRKQSGGET